MIVPSVGVTTLRPMQTMRRRKRLIEFLPALRMATTRRKAVEEVPEPCLFR
jgi:hypothetical protein